MIRGLKITLLILVYVFLCGKSCRDDQDIIGKQIKEVETVKENIREEFSKDYLSEESKYAMELAALQKVNDLADYVTIVSDTSLDSVFRQKAGKMIRDMFSADNDRLSFGPLRNRNIQHLTVEKLIKKGFGDDVAGVKMLFNSLQVEVPLEKTKPGLYEGSLSGVQRLRFFTSSDTIAMEDARVIISIKASKNAKVFGSDTLNTWAVHLGDMTIEP